MSDTDVNIPETVLVQISKAHADGDEICLSIVQEPGIHIRVSLTPQDFADTLCTGRKATAKVIRWRHTPPKPFTVTEPTMHDLLVKPYVVTNPRRKQS